MTESRTPKRWRVVAACCAIAMGALGGAGCSDGAAESGGGQSTGAESGNADVQMSGGYEVRPDGKLLKPKGPVPVLPKKPDRLSENSAMAAEDFARYFIGVAQYAWNSGDTTELRAISYEGCEFCKSMYAVIEERKADGGWSNNLEYKITQLESAVSHPDLADHYLVTMHIRFTTQGTYTGSKLVEGTDLRQTVTIDACNIESKWFSCGGIAARDDS